MKHDQLYSQFSSDGSSSFLSIFSALHPKKESRSCNCNQIKKTINLVKLFQCLKKNNIVNNVSTQRKKVDHVIVIIQGKQWISLNFSNSQNNNIVNGVRGSN